MESNTGGSERADKVPVKNINQPAEAIKEQPPSRPQFASVLPPVLSAPAVLHSYSSMSSKSTINNQNPAPVVMTTFPHHTDLGAVFRAHTTNTYSQQSSEMLPASALSCEQVMSSQTLTPRVQPAPLFDMSLPKKSEVGLRFQVWNCVKVNIFPQVKFLDKDVHGFFDTSNNTVCRTSLDLCFHQEKADLNEARDWWTSARPWVFKTHTDAWNNAIKRMKITYTSKWSAFFVPKGCYLLSCVLLFSLQQRLFLHAKIFLFLFPTPTRKTLFLSPSSS